MTLTIEQRLARLEAREEIRHVEAQYCDRWDRSDARGWAALFTPGGEFVRADVTGVPGHTQRGRAQLESFCRRLQMDYGRLHLLATIDIVVDDEEKARSRIGFQCEMVGTGLYPRPGTVMGYYDSFYTCTREGWRIARRVERQVFKSEMAYYGVDDTDMPSSRPGSGLDDGR